MTLKEKIMKLQTYKMYEGEDTLYVERDDILELLKQEPCEDVVSRKDIYFKLTNGAYSNETIEQFIDRLVKELEASPSVTLQPNVAQWVSKGDPYPAWNYCSNCKEPWTFDCGLPNFCPVCGAKMEKGE